MSEVLTGIVKCFLPEKGFGFLKTDDGKEYFCHQSRILMAGYRELIQGQKVSFTLEQDSDGRVQAVDISREA